MPSVNEQQRRFMAAELARKRAGEDTKTDMTEEQLEDFARKSLPLRTRRLHSAPRRRRGGRRAY